MQVQVTTQPAYGHLHPVVPLCRALLNAGHNVVIASSRLFRAQLEATGLDVISAGGDWLESDIGAAFPENPQHRARGESK